MDQNQIELVTILRDYGIGYEKIATMLEVSTITVRCACAKIEKERELTDSQYPVCKKCGKKIIYERKTRPRISAAGSVIRPGGTSGATHQAEPVTMHGSALFASRHLW